MFQQIFRNFNNQQKKKVQANQLKYKQKHILLGVDYAILDHWSDELLKVSICKFHGANPNEVGNLCLVGHNWRNKRFFSKVPTLEVGDIVQITDLNEKTIEYEVYDIHTVVEDDVSDTTQKTNGRREVTLITCTDDSQQRVIVKCKEKR